MQNSLFDLENRYASLSKTGDPLERLNAIIEWEIERWLGCLRQNLSLLK